MKKLVIILSQFVFIANCYAGPNTFPSSGAVGIGTTSPAFDLHIWDSSSPAEIGLRTDATGEGGGRASIGVRHSDQNYYSGQVYIAPFLYNGSYYFYDTQALIVDGNGIGIGTGNPESELHILDPDSAPEIVMQTQATGGGGGRGVLGVRNSSQGYYAGQVYIAPYAATGGTPSYEYDTTMLVIDPNGVGIGTDDPQSELAVNGTITAKEIQVTTSGWADFVFNDEYELMSLDTLERYVTENRHLPGMPTEKEAINEGIKVSEMTVKLLTKVEELTLHMIELKKQNDQLRAELSSFVK